MISPRRSASSQAAQARARASGGPSGVGRRVTPAVTRRASASGGQPEKDNAPSHAGASSSSSKSPSQQGEFFFFGRSFSPRALRTFVFFRFSLQVAPQRLLRCSLRAYTHRGSIQIGAEIRFANMLLKGYKPEGSILSRMFSWIF